MYNSTNLMEELASQHLKLPLLPRILMVDAAGHVGLEEGESLHGVGGLLQELSLPDLLHQEPLQVRVLLPPQLQLPEVAQPQLSVAIFLESRRKLGFCWAQ